MKKKRGKKGNKSKLPKIKKSFKDFLLNDEGKMAKKDILKMGTSLMVANMFLSAQEAAAQVHTSNFFETPDGYHSSHSSHASHGSHGSHSSY